MHRLFALALAVCPHMAGADAVDDAIAAWVAGDDAAVTVVTEAALAGDGRALVFMHALLLRAPDPAWLFLLPPDRQVALVDRLSDPRTPLAPGDRLESVHLALVEGDARGLVAAGQPYAALSRLAWLSDDDLAAFAAPSALPHLAGPLVGTARDGMLAEVAAGLRDGRASPPVAQILALVPGGANRDEAAMAAAIGLLQADTETAAHRRVCAPCPQPGDCILALWFATAGYFGLLDVQTPLDALIPADVFRGSPRQQNDLVRIAGHLPPDAITDTCLQGILHP
jgi:hypothetical protein